MKFSNLAVFYLWANMYAISTGFLVKPHISVYQHRSPQDFQRLLDAYFNGRTRRKYSTKSPFGKHTKEKRFFEFSPLAFERKTYGHSGNKPFRIFDVKRFFQYSPFIARLQRSHVKPKYESPKPSYRPYVKPVVDHFSGFQRWAPLSKSTFNNRLSSPISRWYDNQNHQKETLENDNFHKSDISSETMDTTFDSTTQPIVNAQSEHGIVDAVKIDSGPSDILNLSNDELYSNNYGKDSAIFNHWQSNAEPKQNMNNNVLQLDTPDKLKNHIGQTANKEQFTGDQDSEEYVWKESDNFHSNSEPVAFDSDHFLTNKPSHFGFQGDIAQTKDAQSIGWGDGFGQVDSFGSVANSETLPGSSIGFGSGVYDTPVLHTKPSPGVWGSFVEDTVRPEAKFDAIPVPPLPSVTDSDEECTTTPGSTCSIDLDCGCYGVYICFQNTCTSVVTEEEEVLPNVWHDGPVEFPGFK